MKIFGYEIRKQKKPMQKRANNDATISAIQMSHSRCSSENSLKKFIPYKTEKASTEAREQ